MAGEITLNIMLSVRKGSLAFTNGFSGARAIDMAGTRRHSSTAVIGTTEELLGIGDVGTPGIALFKNIDDTNFVELGVKPASTFYPFAKLLPGEEYPIRLGTSGVYAKADTASVELDYTVIEA